MPNPQPLCGFPKPEPPPPPLAPTEEPREKKPGPAPRQPEPDKQIRPGSPQEKSAERIVFDEDEVP